MNDPLREKSWSPYVVGAAIGVLSWFAFASANQPIGITTAFEHAVAMAGQTVVPAAAETNAYYADRAADGNSPKVSWEWMLVLGVLLGAALSAWLSGDQTRLKVADLWRWRFGGSVALRFTAAFLGGALMMFGARLALGCTSGHGISGALQLAVSSWVFVVVMFAAAIATAFVLFGKEGRRHV